MTAQAKVSPAAPANDGPDQGKTRSASSDIAEDVTRTHETVANIVDFPDGWGERFQQIAVAGRGGMATVYRAWDNTLSRPVAIKFMRTDAIDSDLDLRFRREASAMARLTHPNIVAVHDTGVGNSHMWMVLEWIDGDPLNELLRRREVRRTEGLAMLATVARAVHHAHERGIVHRDLKPSNILMTKAGTAKVADFGVAHFLADDSALTRTDAAIGTPRYMAPEQADPRRGVITVRTDVYALGVILHEMLTGKTPHNGDSFAAIVHAITHDDPVPLRRLDGRIDVDLEAIALKALEKEPSARYGSAAAFADDIEAFLAGDPVMARRQSAWYRLRKRARKHKLAVSLGALATVATVSSSVWGAMSARQTAEQARIAQRFGQRVESINAIARRSELYPIHDLAADHEIIRGEMASIRREMQRLGEIAAGAGHYALGRGHLALGEPELAEAELARAWDTGYRSPETASARGLALGELYSRQRNIAMRIPDETLREAELAELVTKYRTPALEFLRQAEGSAGDAPEYVRALMALYEQRYGDALAEARAAYGRLPFFHDAIRLEGDIHFEQAHQTAVQAEVDHHLKLAGAAYGRATGVARSDFESYAGLCSLGALYVSNAAGTPEASTGAADYLAACDKALLLVPANAAIHQFISETRSALSENAVRVGGDAEAELVIAIAAGRKAVELGADDAGAYRSLGLAHYTLANLRTLRGDPSRDDIDLAVKNLEKSLELMPRDAFARAHLGQAYSLYAMVSRVGELDPPDAYDRALAALRQVETTSGKLLRIKWETIANVLSSRAHLEHLMGSDPTTTINEALAALDAALEVEGKQEEVLLSKASLHMTRARYFDGLGEDAALDFERAFQSYQEALEASHSNYHYVNLGTARLEAAAHARGMGHLDRVEALLNDADEYLRKANEVAPEFPVPFLRLAELHYHRAELARARGESPLPEVRESMRWLDRASELPAIDMPTAAFKGIYVEPALHWLLDRGERIDGWLDEVMAGLDAVPKDHPAFAFTYESRANLYRIVAEHEPRRDWIDAGLDAADKAIATGMASPETTAEKAILLAVAVDAGQRDPERLTEAKRLFSQALAQQPRLARLHERWKPRLLEESAGSGGG